MDKQEETRVLYSVSTDGQVSRVELQCENEHDLFQVCLGIIQTLNGNEDFMKMLEFIKMSMMVDPEFMNVIDEHTLEIPDFNELLKNKDKENG